MSPSVSILIAFVSRTQVRVKHCIARKTFSFARLQRFAKGFNTVSRYNSQGKQISMFRTSHCASMTVVSILHLWHLYFYVLMSWGPTGGQQTEYTLKAPSVLSIGYLLVPELVYISFAATIWIRWPHTTGELVWTALSHVYAFATRIICMPVYNCCCVVAERYLLHEQPVNDTV